jgi:hypothetical protein
MTGVVMPAKWQRRTNLWRRVTRPKRRLYETALPNVPDAKGAALSLITIAILVLHLLVPAHAGSLNDTQDDIKAFRKDTFVFYCPRCKHAETKVQERAA